MADDSDDDVYSSRDQRCRSAKSGGPTLDQCIKYVMSQKRVEFQGRRQASYVNARRVAERLLQYTHAAHPLYQKYVRTLQNGRVDILNFRAVDADVFLCVVPLKRPIRPSTFTFHYKTPQEFPSHRMLLSLNEFLPREDKIPLKQEWGHCIDKMGILRPDFVLRWFNKGLRNTCDLFQRAEMEKRRSRRRKREKDYFEMFLEKAKDGTLWAYIFMGEDIESVRSFKINFVPSIPLQQVPKQLRISVPIPNRRPYLEERSRLAKAMALDIEQGAELFYLEARIYSWNVACGYQECIAVSWGVGCTGLEDRTYKEISKITPSSFLDSVILLMGQIKSEHHVGLHPVSNRVILNAIFHTHRKQLGKFTRGAQWFLGVMELLSSQLKDHFAPAFYLNKLNLFEGWNVKSLNDTGKEIKRMLQQLKRNPETLYDITGYMEEEPEEEMLDADDTKQENYADEPKPKQQATNTRLEQEPDDTELESEETESRLEQEERQEQEFTNTERAWNDKQRTHKEINDDKQRVQREFDEEKKRVQRFFDEEKKRVRREFEEETRFDSDTYLTDKDSRYRPLSSASDTGSEALRVKVIENGSEGQGSQR